MSFLRFQADQTKEETLISITKNFLMASASKVNISINKKTNFKKETHEIAFKKYVAVKVSIWEI